jgi:hypothetical protein
VRLEAAVLRLADPLAARLGILERPFTPEQLMVSAERRTGLNDFGGLDIRGPLERLLHATMTEAGLNLIGRFATRWDVLRFLCNLLRLRAAEQVEPSILREPVERPIFITGLPRSGTTFLHRLMLEDPQNRAPRVWQTIDPYPARGSAHSIRTISRHLRAFERLAPEFRNLHPLGAESPQECSEIHAHVFRSLRFDTTHHIPSYRQWLEAAGHLDAYQFQRRFLQHLQHAVGRGQWVLKCPDHLFALHDLRAVFPDARLVFVHRDPLKVLLSVAKLTEVLRRPFSRRIDTLEIGRQESARWLDGARRMITAASDPLFAEAICHVHYLDLATNPVRTIDTVYRHFGLEFGDDTAARVARIVAKHPNGGYGHHSYQFATHGLQAEEEREKFAHYSRYFEITPESDRGYESMVAMGSKTTRRS